MNIVTNPPCDVTCFVMYRVSQDELQFFTVCRSLACNKDFRSEFIKYSYVLLINFCSVFVAVGIIYSLCVWKKFLVW